MDVLVLTPEAYGGFGGVSVYNVDLIDALCELPYVSSVTVVPRLVRETPRDVPSKVDLVSRAARGLGAFGAAVAKLAKRRFDLVICTHMHLLPFAKPIAVVHGTPLFCMLYGVEAWVPTRRFMVDRLVKDCDALISISRYTIDRFREWSRVPYERVALLPNCVHAERYGMGAKPTYLVDRYGASDRRIVMTLGRLDARERQKGIDEMIDALPAMLEDTPNLLYLVAGDGDDRPRLEERVRSKALDEHVVFAGRIPDSELADHYRLCDVFSMAGRQEGFGFVFLEAMACGAPVVASELDGSRDAVLDGELGELANPDKLVTLRSALARALARPRQVPSRLEHFSFENFTLRLDGIVRPYVRR